MTWLEPAEARSMQIPKGTLAQTILLPTLQRELHKAIPSRPQVALGAEGPASYIWYATLGDRLISVTFEVKESDQVTILTPFQENRLQKYDWMVLQDLEALSLLVYPTRPLYIQSRAKEGGTALFRRHPRGWDALVYRGRSREDVSSLLHFLSRDEWNEGCFIGPDDDSGEWRIIRIDDGRESEIGGYTSRQVAIQAACDISERDTSQSFKVRDLASATIVRSYEISGRRVRL